MLFRSDQILAASRLYLEKGATELGPEERTAAISFALGSTSTHVSQARSHNHDKDVECAASKPRKTGVATGSPGKKPGTKTSAAPKRRGRKPGTSDTTEKKGRAKADKALSSIWLEKPASGEGDGKPVPKPKSTSTSTDKRQGQESDDSSDWLTAELAARGLEYRDMRDRGGCLWVKGGKLLTPAMKGLEDMGAVFAMKTEGCRAFKGEAAWWLKGYPDKR